jgi:hypothetical protein
MLSPVPHETYAPLNVHRGRVPVAHLHAAATGYTWLEDIASRSTLNDLLHWEATTGRKFDIAILIHHY